MDVIDRFEIGYLLNLLMQMVWNLPRRFPGHIRNQVEIWQFLCYLVQVLD